MSLQWTGTKDLNGITWFYFVVSHCVSCWSGKSPPPPPASVSHNIHWRSIEMGWPEPGIRTGFRNFVLVDSLARASCARRCVLRFWGWFGGVMRSPGFRSVNSHLFILSELTIRWSHYTHWRVIEVKRSKDLKRVLNCVLLGAPSKSNPTPSGLPYCITLIEKLYWSNNDPSQRSARISEFDFVWNPCPCMLRVRPHRFGAPITFIKKSRKLKIPEPEMNGMSWSHLLGALREGLWEDIPKPPRGATTATTTLGQRALVRGRGTIPSTDPPDPGELGLVAGICEDNESLLQDIFEGRVCDVWPQKLKGDIVQEPGERRLFLVFQEVLRDGNTAQIS